MNQNRRSTDLNRLEAALCYLDERRPLSRVLKAGLSRCVLPPCWQAPQRTTRELAINTAQVGVNLLKVSTRSPHGLHMTSARQAHVSTGPDIANDQPSLILKDLPGRFRITTHCHTPSTDRDSCAVGVSDASDAAPNIKVVSHMH
jgi:hypothetical protein